VCNYYLPSQNILSCVRCRRFVTSLFSFLIEIMLQIANISQYRITTYQYQQEHSDSADLRQGEYSPDADCGVRIRVSIPDLDYFQNAMGTSWSKDTFLIKFSWRFDQLFSGDILAKLRKLSYFSMLKNPEKFPDLHKMQIISEIWWVFLDIYSFIHDQIFMKIRSL